ncbi:hypothetical protein EF910_27080 [Streptomyces sp. WAC07149]|uniref:LppU/SCO3897 family protein n=1 Tax=Streptomyces sp. WAC07149 TaxID=2487425 RepID=UPI000F7B4737|nr:hypothetical protein [Streptomyces sp. WAC07149]RST01679.1 hypothetical protein EF910_27080 [Streptomyces sp. WAC07149]
MSPSQEIELVLTPAQAATGLVVPVTLPTGPQRLRIPPARNGDLVRARVGDTEVLIRIRVSGPPAPPPTAPQPAPAGKSGALGCLVALAVVAVVISLVIANSDDDSTPTASASPTAGSTYTPYTPPTYTPPTYRPPTYTPPTYVPAPAPPPTTEAAPSPFDTGTCLNGQLPDSTTAQTVRGVKEVSCSADDAHYRVIQRFPGTHDMSRCDANPRTEYGFSYQYTLNGSVINEYVYCLVGIGSYSRA